MARKSYQDRPLTESERQFFAENILLVGRFLQLFGGKYRTCPDLEQELMVGLGIAIITYDSTKSKFSTHAFWRFQSIKSQYFRKQKLHRIQCMSELNVDENIKIEPSYDSEKTELDEFREFIQENTTPKEREFVRELALQPVNLRWLTSAQRHQQIRSRLRIIDRIRQTFRAGEVSHGKKQRAGKRPAPDNGRGLRNGTQLVLFGSNSHDHSGRAIS